MFTFTREKTRCQKLIKQKQKHNVEVKIECVMWNEWIDGLTINHSFTPLLKKKRMWVLNAKEMESSSKINLKDVLWCMSIKNACRLGALVTTKLSKEGCITLVMEGRLSWVTWKHECYHELHENVSKRGMGPPQLEKHTPPKLIYQKYKT
jgi:hypothetical protein